ncbi:MAG: hypothetical protein AB1700_20250, partial [Bacillota bacterium]
MNRGRPRRNRDFVFKIIMYAILIPGALVMITPLLWMISTSLAPDSVIVSYRFIPSRITLANYVKAWEFPRVFDESVSIGTFFKNSLIVTILITGPA